MLLYDNKARLRLLLQFYGSIYQRIYVAVIIFGIYSIVLVVLKKHGKNDWLFMPVMDNPFAAQAMGVLMAFTVTFRTTIATHRFWEACREMMFMYSKWSDAYSQLMGFITSTEKAKGLIADKDNCDRRRLEHARMEVTHFFSLLSAVATERLMRGHIRRMEMRRQKGVPWSEQVATWGSLVHGADLTGSKTLFPMRVLIIGQSEDLEIGKDVKSRTSAPSDPTADRADVRWMSVYQRSGTVDLGACSSMSPGGKDDTWKEPLSVVGEASMEELKRLRGSQDRVNLVLLWVNELVTATAPHLVIPPPVISRVFQEISNGALAYSQAEKLADIPFPFVFAQILAVAMLFIAIVFPICFTLITGESWFTPMLSTGVVTFFWALNEIAKELENPFGKEANNVPLLDAHERFVEFLTEMHGICLPRDRDFKPVLPNWMEQIDKFLVSASFSCRSVPKPPQA